MSAVGKEEMVKKIPRWESRLWSYVSYGDGEHCPIRNHCHCQFKKKCSWCMEEHKNQVEQLLNSKRYGLKNCDAICIGRVVSGDIYQRVARLAHSYLKRGNVHCLPVPTELVFLADEESAIEIRPVRLKTHTGALWRLGDSWIIHVNSNEPLSRQRFTLFHEAFHILAHCRASPTPIFRKRGVNGGSFNELLADYFAMHVLIPTEWVKEEWANVNSLDNMAKLFRVPRAAMWVRLKFLGVI